MWLSGRHPQTSYKYLGIDFLRKFGYSTGAHISSDLMSQPTRDLSDTPLGEFHKLASDSYELRRYDESSLLRDKRLSQKQRIVLILYYEWGFNLKEIGDVLGVSESRISQVHNKVLHEQKKRIQKILKLNIDMKKFGM